MFATISNVSIIDLLANAVLPGAKMASARVVHDKKLGDLEVGSLLAIVIEMTSICVISSALQVYLKKLSTVIPNRSCRLRHARLQARASCCAGC